MFYRCGLVEEIISAELSSTSNDAAEDPSCTPLALNFLALLACAATYEESTLSLTLLCATCIEHTRRASFECPACASSPYATDLYCRSSIYGCLYVLQEGSFESPQARYVQFLNHLRGCKIYMAIGARHRGQRERYVQ
ncbi:hypothetical protein A0H81_10887 [Grifola frondosa]|uniref:Uncharacterized protein n=1 Tax=Grifola frondosa TaxID=5627 RepID=A0A1C7LX57_GRIFR|nr:hypothetical protein A0H81_10887 [Grifola frondosa]